MCFCCCCCCCLDRCHHRNRCHDHGPYLQGIQGGDAGALVLRWVRQDLGMRPRAQLGWHSRSLSRAPRQGRGAGAAGQWHQNGCWRRRGRSRAKTSGPTKRCAALSSPVVGLRAATLLSPPRPTPVRRLCCPLISLAPRRLQRHLLASVRQYLRCRCRRRCHPRLVGFGTDARVGRRRHGRGSSAYCRRRCQKCCCRCRCRCCLGLQPQKGEVSVTWMMARI
mmetsp:Transcript_31493/g.62876  ORF Transcript_31493/g.62876 Transcript_31493/m.62876 type:complete len:222 (-) Transcript_31493:819-1484(-)